MNRKIRNTKWKKKNNKTKRNSHKKGKRMRTRTRSRKIGKENEERNQWETPRKISYAPLKYKYNVHDDERTSQVAPCTATIKLYRNEKEKKKRKTKLNLTEHYTQTWTFATRHSPHLPLQMTKQWLPFRCYYYLCSVWIFGSYYLHEFPF